MIKIGTRGSKLALWQAYHIQELLENTPEATQFSLLTNTENLWNTDIKSSKSNLQNLKYSAAPFELSTIMAKIKSEDDCGRKFF